MEKKLSAVEITEYYSKSTPRIPITGIKYFEPNGSSEEHKEIQNYLEATKKLISFEKVRKLGSMSEAKWDSELQKAEVTNQVGSCWTTMGHTINKKLYLFPEEALYLLEMGALEITYDDMVLSVQRAYSLLLKPATSVTIECYRVYSQLTANGYGVVRHMQGNILTKYQKELKIFKAGIKLKNIDETNRKHKLLNSSKIQNTEIKKQKMENLTELFPLKFMGENENEYLKKLRIFESFHDNSKPSLQIHYDIHLANGSKNSFKKTCLQLPKCRVIVHSGSDSVPDLKEFYHLVHQFEDDVPLIHAIVFPDFISYYNINAVKTPFCE